jgi:hypothetical protein
MATLCSGGHHRSCVRRLGAAAPPSEGIPSFSSVPDAQVGVRLRCRGAQSPGRTR